MPKAVNSAGVHGGFGALRGNPALASRSQQRLNEHLDVVAVELYGFGSLLLSFQKLRRAGPA
jgi:hypothetical protein